MAVMFPSAAGSANAAFNPARYYAEAGQTANDIPGSRTRGASGAALTGVYLPVLVVILLLWFLERRRLGIALKASA